MEQARCGNALLKRRCNADKTLRLRYSFDLRPCKMSCSYLGAVMNEKDSLRERDFMGISVDKYLIPVLKPRDYSMIARYIFSRFLPEQLNSALLLNRDIPDHGGIRNSTLAHEASHSFLGRYFFLLQKGGAERLPCVAVNDSYS